jgi:hypothetical protein
MRTCLKSAAEHAEARLGQAGLAELLEIRSDNRQLLAKVATEPVRVNADTFIKFSVSPLAARAVARAGCVRQDDGDPEPFAIRKEALAEIVADGTRRACALAKDDAKNYVHLKEGVKKGGFEGPSYARRWSCCGSDDKDARGCHYVAPASLDRYIEEAFSQLVEESEIADLDDILDLC